MFPDFKLLLNDNLKSKDNQPISILIPKIFTKEHLLPNFRKNTTYLSKNFRTIDIQLSTQKRLTIPSDMKEENIHYIENFLEYLFDYRKNKYEETKSLEITKEELTNFLEKYLKENQENIKIRQNARKLYIQSKEKEHKINQYKKSCIIERKPFIDSITYLINHDNSIPYSIKNTLDHEIHHIQHPDLINIEKLKQEDTFIHFYEIKRNMSHHINKINILKEYLTELETIYQEKNYITHNDISIVFSHLINKRKNKNLTLSKENVIHL